MTRIERLKRLGMRLRVVDRNVLGDTAHVLRAIHKRLMKRRAMAEDDLLELADDLSTLASPIVVTRPKGKR